MLFVDPVMTPIAKQGNIIIAFAPETSIRFVMNRSRQSTTRITTTIALGDYASLERLPIFPARV